MWHAGRVLVVWSVDRAPGDVINVGFASGSMYMYQVRSSAALQLAMAGRWAAVLRGSGMGHEYGDSVCQTGLESVACEACWLAGRLAGCVGVVWDYVQGLASAGM